VGNCGKMCQKRVTKNRRILLTSYEQKNGRIFREYFCAKKYVINIHRRCNTWPGFSGGKVMNSGRLITVFLYGSWYTIFPDTNLLNVAGAANTRKNRLTEMRLDFTYIGTV
jgi:hypothetical protein